MRKTDVLKMRKKDILKMRKKELLKVHKKVFFQRKVLELRLFKAGKYLSYLLPRDKYLNGIQLSHSINKG